MFARRGDEAVAHLVNIATVSYTHWQPETHARTAVMPVGYRRVDETRIGHDDHDAIIGPNLRAARANLLHLLADHRVADAFDFDAITVRYWLLSQEPLP